MGVQNFRPKTLKKKSFQGSKVNGFGHWILKPLMREQGLVAYI